MERRENKPRWPNITLVIMASYDISAESAVNEAHNAKKIIIEDLELGNLFVVKGFNGNQLKTYLVKPDELHDFVKKGYIVHNPDVD